MKKNIKRSVYSTVILIGFAAFFYTKPLPVFAQEEPQPAGPQFKTDLEETNALMKFLAGNTLETGLPFSYRAPKGYWKSIGSRPDDLDDLMERLLVGEEGFDQAGTVNIYDAALWQIVMAISGRIEDADRWTERLLSNSSGGLRPIRATAQHFTFNGEKLAENEAYFFRMFGNRYFMSDPLDGKDALIGFPSIERLHHEDWKPVTGDNAWAAIIGPLQCAYLKTNGHISLESPEAKLALSILPAIRAMQSPLGAIYRAPEGTYGEDPRDISNENNFSVYAALRMLREVVRQNQNKKLDDEITAILVKMEDYFRKYAFDKDAGVFYQGGLYIDGEFKPSEDFAVDCQTWGIAVLGSAWIDGQFGEGAAYQIWQKTKERSGYFEDGVLKGVGFSDTQDILSSDWTFGAVLMARLLSSQYESSHTDWAKDLAKDALTMREGAKLLKVKLADGSSAYQYANQRHYVIFGWWANPIPCLAGSAWAVLVDNNFNPFVLGGSF